MAAAEASSGTPSKRPRQSLEPEHEDSPRTRRTRLGTHDRPTTHDAPHLAADELYGEAAVQLGTQRLFDALPIVYTIYTNTDGKVGPEIRAIVKHGDAAPEVTGTDVPVMLRGQGRGPEFGKLKKDHLYFPVDVYYVKLDMRAEYRAGEITFAGRPVPKITRNPATWSVMGDTGLRVKKKAKSFQSLAGWAAPMIGKASARVGGGVETPDISVHMGDYIYRENPGEGECAAITDTAEWGDNMLCWYAEFFEPFKSLLDVAPMVAARGNHENTSRMGPGWNFLMGTGDWNKKCDWLDADSLSPKFCEPFAIEFEKSVIYMVDNGDHHEQSIDHYNFEDAHQAKLDSDILIDPTFNHSKEAAEDDALLTNTYSKLSAHAKQAQGEGKVTFLLQHLPAFAVVCDGPQWVGYNPNVQKAFFDAWTEPKTLCAILSGHMHWYQRWASATMPTQMVIGNGGTLLIPDYGIPPRNGQRVFIQKANQKGGMQQIELNGTIKHGYGYSIFRQDAAEGAFECVHFLLDPCTHTFVEKDRCAVAKG